jgi:two-component sensor histidine kinase
MTQRDVRRQLRDAWMGIAPASPTVVAGLIVSGLAIATIVRWFIATIRPDIPFTLYIPVIIAAALMSGSRAAVLATAGSAALGLLTAFEGSPDLHAKLLLLAIFVVITVPVVWVANHYRTVTGTCQSAMKRLQAEEDYRRVVVGELSHRLKNKLSTIHAVAHQALRNHPQAWAALDGRLRALGATDDLIIKSDHDGCDLRELFEIELSPYGTQRVTIEGGAVHVGARLAVGLSLVIHELSTNAAKYGCLSNPDGRLVVAWSTEADRLDIVWQETSSVAIAPPATQGFGSRLIQFALQPFHGHVTLDYAPNGLRCTMTCQLKDQAEPAVVTV